MAVLQMQRISICALKHDRKAILEKLQSMGMIEMHQVAQDEAGFEKMDTQSAKSSFEKRVQITEAWEPGRFRWKIRLTDLVLRTAILNR